jgi:hypothetical protein
MRPTLLSSCAQAATAPEARYRIDFPEPAARSARVIALDQRAAGYVRSIARRAWHGGHFLIFDHLVVPPGAGLESANAVLRDPGGAPHMLTTELEDADAVVMVASPDASGAAATVIGDACALRFIMTAALVVGDEGAEPGQPGPVHSAVAALRPNAMVLVRLASSDDIAEILTALRV